MLTNLNVKTIFIKSLLVALSLLAIAAINKPLSDASLWLIGCFGASVVLIAAKPESPLASTRAILIGLIGSAWIGLMAGRYIPEPITAIIAACVAAMAIMVLFDAEHPHPAVRLH